MAKIIALRVSVFHWYHGTQICCFRYLEIRRFGDSERGLGLLLMVVCTILHCPPYSVLGESNECNDLNADALAFGETRRIKRLGDTEGFDGR